MGKRKSDLERVERRSALSECKQLVRTLFDAHGNCKLEESLLYTLLCGNNTAITAPYHSSNNLTPAVKMRSFRAEDDSPNGGSP